MSAKKTKHGNLEWLSAEEMHEQSKKWISELSFIKDEQHILKNLIHYFAYKPINIQEVGRIKDFKNSIAENQRRLNPIFNQVQKHMNQVPIMMDGVFQLEMEKAYQKTHNLLFLKMNRFLLDYRTVKKRGLLKLSSILRSGKQKVALGNPDYKITIIQTEK